MLLVTGASSGIGEAAARVAATAGARVVLVARRADKLEAIVDELRAAGGEAHAFVVDVGDAEAVASLAEQVREEVGAPQILINNAGAGAWKYLEETPPDEAVQMMAAPYFAAVYATQAFLPAMRAAGQGHIVNVTSVAGHFAVAGATTYSAARWAMRGFSEALSQDLADSGVRVALATFAKVESGYWSAHPGTEERVPGAQALVRVLSAEQAGAAIIRGIGFDQHQIVEPELRALLIAGRVFPGPLRWLLRATAPTRQS